MDATRLVRPLAIGLASGLAVAWSVAARTPEPVPVGTTAVLWTVGGAWLSYGSRRFPALRDGRAQTGGLQGRLAVTTRLGWLALTAVLTVAYVLWTRWALTDATASGLEPWVAVATSALVPTASGLLVFVWLRRRDVADAESAAE